MMLALNRKIHRAYARVREGNFALEGLLGFDLHGKTVGVVGTGQIGARLRAHHDRLRLPPARPRPVSDSEAARAIGVELPRPRCSPPEADIVSLHCPLTPETRHLHRRRRLAPMKRGAMLVNTSRGAILDTPAVIAALKSGQLGYLALDVYEEEDEALLRGPVGQGDRRRRLRAPADLPQRPDHRPPGLLHRRSDDAPSRRRRWPTSKASRGPAARCIPSPAERGTPRNHSTPRAAEPIPCRAAPRPVRMCVQHHAPLAPSSSASAARSPP